MRAASKIDAICLRALVLSYRYSRAKRSGVSLFHKLATVLDELDCEHDVFLMRAKMMLSGQLHYLNMGLHRLALPEPWKPITALRRELSKRRYASS